MQPNFNNQQQKSLSPIGTNKSRAILTQAAPPMNSTFSLFDKFDSSINKPPEDTSIFDTRSIMKALPTTNSTSYFTNQNLLQPSLFNANESCFNGNGNSFLVQEEPLFRSQLQSNGPSFLNQQPLANQLQSFVQKKQQELELEQQKLISVYENILPVVKNDEVVEVPGNLSVYDLFKRGTFALKQSFFTKPDFIKELEMVK